MHQCGGRRKRMTDEQIAHPSCSRRFKQPCGWRTVGPPRGRASVVVVRPRVFAPVRRLRRRRPIANCTRACRWTARHASGTSGSAVGSGARLRSAGSLRGGRRRAWRPFATVERGRQAGGIPRFLRTSLTSCSANRGRRALAAIAYAGSLTIAQPLQPRSALICRRASDRTGRRPPTPKLLLPKLLLPICFPACAFYCAAQVPYG
jgi:hypothetical protein